MELSTISISDEEKQGGNSSCRIEDDDLATDSLTCATPGEYSIIKLKEGDEVQRPKISMLKPQQFGNFDIAYTSIRIFLVVLDLVSEVRLGIFDYLMQGQYTFGAVTLIFGMLPSMVIKFKMKKDKELKSILPTWLFIVHKIFRWLPLSPLANCYIVMLYCGIRSREQNENARKSFKKMTKECQTASYIKLIEAAFENAPQLFLQFAVLMINFGKSTDIDVTEASFQIILSVISLTGLANAVTFNYQPAVEKVPVSEAEVKDKASADMFIGPSASGTKKNFSLPHEENIPVGKLLLFAANFFACASRMIDFGEFISSLVYCSFHTIVTSLNLFFLAHVGIVISHLFVLKKDWNGRWADFIGLIAINFYTFFPPTQAPLKSLVLKDDYRGYSFFPCLFNYYVVIVVEKMFFLWFQCDADSSPNWKTFIKIASVLFCAISIFLFCIYFWLQRHRHKDRLRITVPANYDCINETILQTILAADENDTDEDLAERIHSNLSKQYKSYCWMVIVTTADPNMILVRGEGNDDIWYVHTNVGFRKTVIVFQNSEQKFNLSFPDDPFKYRMRSAFEKAQSEQDNPTAEIVLENANRLEKTISHYTQLVMACHNDPKEVPKWIANGSLFYDEIMGQYYVLLKK